MSYDKTTVDQYVELGGGYCPECDCQDVTRVHARSASQPEDGILWIEWSCRACKAIWQDRYILDDVECMSEGLHHNQNDMFANTG